MASDLLDAFGVDATRYVLMREVPHGQDGNFSYTHAVQRINSDLANGLGNLAQRTLSIIAKNGDGILPAPGGDLTAEDTDILAHAHERLIPAVRSEFGEFRFHRGLEAIWRLVDAANAYIDTQAPWALKKTDPARMNTVLYVLAEVIRCLAIAVQPVVPDSAGKILDQVGIGAEDRTYVHVTAASALKPGAALPPPQGVFPRIQPQDRQEACG